MNDLQVTNTVVTTKYIILLDKNDNTKGIISRGQYDINTELNFNFRLFTNIQKVFPSYKELYKLLSYYEQVKSEEIETAADLVINVIPKLFDSFKIKDEKCMSILIESKDLIDKYNYLKSGLIDDLYSIITTEIEELKKDYKVVTV